MGKNANVQAVRWPSLFWPSLLIVVALMSGRPAERHPIHTSIAQMQYNAAQKSFEVSVRIFTDDLETALTRHNNNQRVRLGIKDNHDPLVERYLRDHFVVSNARKQRKVFQYVGKEQEVDATWIYLEIPFAEPVEGSTVQNDVLMELFDDQVNLVNVSYRAQKKTLLLKPSQRLQELRW